MGSSVQSSPTCSETLPFLLFFHRPRRHRISKEEARSEAEPEGCPASALSTEPLPWHSDQRTAGPGAWHCRKQSSGRAPLGPPGLCPRSPFPALQADPSQLKAPGGLSPEKEFSLFAPPQVWFQNQRRRRSKQSRSPSEHVHQEGEAGPTSTPTPPSPSPPPRPQSSSPGNLASVLPEQVPQRGSRTLPLLPENSLCWWMATGGPGKPRGQGGVGARGLGWWGEEEETGLSGRCRLPPSPISVPEPGHDAPSRHGRAALGPPLHPLHSPRREL